MHVRQINLMPGHTLPDALCRALIETAAMGNGLNVDAGCPRRLTYR